MADFRSATEKITKKRAQIKRRITIRINGLKDQTLNSIAFKKHEAEIDSFLAEIKVLNSQIEDVCNELDINHEEELERDMAMESEFSNRVIHDLSILESLSRREEEITVPRTHAATSIVENDHSLRPMLKCSIFDGLDCESNKFKFKNFLMQFENCVSCIKSGATKLQYLRGYLAGYPLQLVQHLSITEENFDTAIQLLKKEYLDQEFIISAIFNQIDKAEPKPDLEFIGIKKFLTETRANLCELKCSYDLDFLEENTPGNKYLGYSIFAKLPNALKKEIIHVVGTNYPSLNQIMDNYADVIKTLVITKTAGSPSKPGSQQPPDNRPRRSEQYKNSKTFSTLENFATEVETRSAQKHCKFCAADGHYSRFCAKYHTLDARKARCTELRLCTLCTSAQHTANACPGTRNKLSYPCKICRTRKHNTALCAETNLDKKHSMTTSACYNTGTRKQITTQ